MYTKSELEYMKFNELKRLAREMNISRHWTCKREIIDQLMSTGQNEDLDMITVTLVDSPDSTKSNSGSEVGAGDSLCVPRQTTMEVVGRARSAQSRFPKPRMTVFEAEVGSPVSKAESPHKRNQRYFVTPTRVRKSKANESFSCSVLEHVSEVVSSRKKKLSHAFASTETAAVSEVTFRDHRRPITRSYKNRFLCLDLSNSTDEHNLDFISSENACAASGGDEYNSTTSSTRTTRRTQRLTGTIRNLGKNNSDPGEKSKNIKWNNSFSVSDIIDMPEKEMKDTGSCGRKQEIKFSRGGMKKDTSDTRMEDSHMSMKPEAWKCKPGTEESSPKYIFDETFEIQNESTKSSMGFSLEANIKDVQPHKLSGSIKGKRISTSPVIMQGHNKTSTPKDDTDDKENETSDFGSMNATFELPCTNNLSTHTSDMENNKSRRKKRSFSCPREKRDEEAHSEAVFFSPVANFVTSSKPQHRPKRGTLSKDTKIPRFVKKMPDFTNIHKREFEKMESVVDCHQRKLNRAKMLFSPKLTKDVPSVMVFNAQPSATKQIPSRTPVTFAERNVLPANQVNKNISQRVPGERNDLQCQRPHSGRLVQRHDVKQMVTKKLPLRKMQGGVREVSRTTIRGVRLNRRFELQMAHRKMK